MKLYLDLSEVIAMKQLMLVKTQQISTYRAKYDPNVSGLSITPASFKNYVFFTHMSTCVCLQNGDTLIKQAICHYQRIRALKALEITIQTGCLSYNCVIITYFSYNACLMSTYDISLCR